MSTARRLIEGSLLNTLTLVIGVLISFFLMPYMVTSLGDRMYGVWTIVAEFLWYYGLLDFGLSSAIGRFLSRAIGGNDKQETRVVTATAFYLTLGLGILAMCATFIFTLGAGWFVKDPADLQVFRILLFIVGINFAFEFPVRVFNAVLGANLRFDIRNLISTIKNLSIPLLIVLAIKGGMGVIGVALVTFIASLGDSAARIYFAFKIEPSLSLAWKDVLPAKSRQLFGYSVYTFIGKIADILRFKIDLFVISSLIGLASVTHFFIGVRLLDYFMKFVSSAVEVIGPVFSRDEGKKDFTAIRRNLFFVSKISVYLSVFLGGVAIFIGRPFISRWMGSDYSDSYNVLLILIVPGILSLAQNPGEQLLYGISKHRFLALGGIIEGVANAALSIFLATRIGIFGVAVGTAVPMTIRYLIQPFYVSHNAGMSSFSYPLVLIRHMAWGFAALGIGCLLTRSFVQPNYWRLILVILAVSSVYWPFVMIFGFQRVEREKIFGFFQRRS